MNGLQTDLNTQYTIKHILLSTNKTEYMKCSECNRMEDTYGVYPFY